MARGLDALIHLFEGVVVQFSELDGHGLEVLGGKLGKTGFFKHGEY